MDISNTAKNIKLKVEDINENFKIVSFYSGTFIWQEAFAWGDYYPAHFSAMGKCADEKAVTARIGDGRFKSAHRKHAFALEIDGMRLRKHWRWEGHEIDGNTMAVKLAYDMLGVQVVLRTAVGDSGFIKRWMEVKNIGDEKFAVTGMFPWCGIVAADHYGVQMDIPYNEEKRIEIGSFKSAYHLAEGEFFWQEAPIGTLKLSQQRRNYAPPLYMIRNNETGEHTVMYCECTANHQFEAYRSSDMKFKNIGAMMKDYVYCRLGLAEEATYRTIAPGESAAGPPVHFTVTYGDINSCVTKLHSHIRGFMSLLPPREPKYPVTYNHCGYTQCVPMPYEVLANEVDIAAAIGAELFTVDAGWFGKGEDYAVSAGDWCENRLLNGRLAEAFDYARSKGLMCGLWMEPERVHPNSDFGKSAPTDWFIHLDGGNMWIMDMSNPEVEDYIVNLIAEKIKKYRLDLFRLDYNAEIFTGGELVVGGHTEQTMWKHIDALHRIYEKLREIFPHVYFENCSSGGGRNDGAMMRRFHWAQISDNWAPYQEVRIFNGISMGMAPEQCSSILGINLDRAEADFAVRAGIFGQMCISGYAPSLDAANEELMNRWKHNIEMHKAFIRPMFREGTFYHHTPIQDYSNLGELVAMEMASADKTRCAAGIFRLPMMKGNEYIFKPMGLDISRSYNITFDNSGKTIAMTGESLYNNGVKVVLPCAMTSEMLYFTAI